jgi:hypothetical protein
MADLLTPEDLDRERNRAQWMLLLESLRTLGYSVTILDGFIRVVAPNGIVTRIEFKRAADQTLSKAAAA